MLQFLPEQADHRVLFLLIRLQPVLKVLIVAVKCSETVSQSRDRLPGIIQA